jgi:hypothetical protein
MNQQIGSGSFRSDSLIFKLQAHSCRGQMLHAALMHHSRAMGLGSKPNHSMQGPMQEKSLTSPSTTSGESCPQCPQRKRRTCEHGRFQPYCKDCKGNMLCEHLRHKNRCAVCKQSRGGNNNIVLVVNTVIR